jgi:hypothetical protein
MEMSDAIMVQFVMPEPPSEALRTWQRERTEWMAHGKFTPTGQTADTLTYQRRSIPGWAVVCAILLFPLGLLAVFFARRVDLLSLRFEAHGPGCLVTLTGAAEERSRISITNLSNEYNAAATTALEERQAGVAAS